MALDPKLESLARKLLNTLQLDVAVLTLKTNLGSDGNRIKQIALQILNGIVLLSDLHSTSLLLRHRYGIYGRSR